jgi:ABC-type amino acid transport substrate-binding protein
LLLCASPASLASEPQTVTLAVPDHEPLTEGGLGIVTEMYRRIGYQVRELRRSPREADAVETDGEVMRAAEPGQRFAELIAIPGALIEDDIVAFTAGHPALLPRGWVELRGRSVCTRPGIAPVEEKLNAVSGVKLTFAAESAQAFRLLKAGRCDFAVLPRSAWIEAQAAGIGGLVEASPALDHFTTVHLVARRRGMLVPSLAAVLRQLRSEGFVARVQAELDAAITEAEAESSSTR